MIEAAPPSVSEPAVLDALRAVLDPELDESLVELGFVDSVGVERGNVDVVLRLPTFWCAPNFAYFMAVDAREAIGRVAGVEHVDVRLKDHMYSDEISLGVTSGFSFEDIFPGQADGDDVEALRGIFRRKAFGMRQEQLVRYLLDAGLTNDEVVALRMVDVLDTSDEDGLSLRVGGRLRLFRAGASLTRTYLTRRAWMGIDGSELITDDRGRPIAASDLTEYMRRTRRQRISMTFNSLMCRGLLETRYGETQ
jgi:metal-sulfur cluster biosynthetic enzyme